MSVISLALSRHPFQQCFHVRHKSGLLLSIPLTVSICGPQTIGAEVDCARPDARKHGSFHDALLLPARCSYRVFEKKIPSTLLLNPSDEHAEVQKSLCLLPLLYPLGGVFVVVEVLKF